MKNPTLAQIGGLSGGIGDDIRQLQDRLDGEKIQQALNNPDHPFRQGVVTLALTLFPALVITEKGGVIYVTFIANGWSGPEWVAHFQKRGIELSPNALTILNSSQFKASKAGTSRSVAILKGELFAEADRITSKIRAKAAGLKLKNLDMETQCLIRDGLTNKAVNDLGLNWIVGMHEPVEIGGGPDLLTADARDGVPRLEANYGGPDDGWRRASGFAFDASQVVLKA